MSLSATLANVGGGGNESVKSVVSPRNGPSSSGANAIPSLVNANAPFSATEALQAALTTRYASSAMRIEEMQAAPSTTSGAATAALQAASAPQVVMSTIGLGIDLGHGGNSAWDATEASVRALRDAMERSTLRLPYLTSLSDAQLRLHVKLGVPPKNSQAREPMVVDLAAVTAVLPRSIPIDVPIQVVVGGLSVPGIDGSEPTVCAAIASVSIQALPEPIAPSQGAIEQLPWAPLMSQAPEQHNPQAVRPTVASGNPGRVDSSMDILAHISSAVRDNPDIVSERTPFARAITAARSSESFEEHSRKDLPATEEDTSSEASTQGDQDPSQETSSAPRKPKLRPGLTAGKKNTRRFVEHDYHDHSHEEPLPGENGYGPIGGDNMAFPFKMHDTLTRIEVDGYNDIMSWMPHGRSFKIHDLDGFHDHVLPMYFRHSKKSSLLRQLNLYGFRRICAGPDKGSYYHELFLRGKRFLCGRMRRVKVNGKRIRSAGNPETEPVFSTMDPMPPTVSSDPILNIHTVSSDVSEEEDDDDPFGNEEVGDGPIGSVSYASISFPFKLQALLDLLDAKGETSVVSWLPHGRAFRVHNPNAFVRLLMPRYFSMSKFSSFQRQLHLYSFQRVTHGADRGAYFNPNFLRGHGSLCRDMKRTVVNGKGCRKPSDPSKDPEFYRMPPIPSLDPSLVELPLNMPELPTMLDLADEVKK